MFHRILVGFDGTPAGRGALRFAVQLAAPDATMTVATVAVERLETGFATEVDALTGLPASDRALLAEARELLHDRAGVTYVAPAAPSVGSGLHALASTDSCDLLVVGASDRHGVRRVLSGSDTEDALHGAPCAVCVVPVEAPAELRRIGTGFDGSAPSRPATDVAAALAAQSGAALSLLTVVDTEHPFIAYDPGGDLAHDGRRLLDKEIARVDADQAPGSVLSEGDPATELLALAKDVDLLVLGGRGHGPVLRVLLGSVAGEVVRRAPCPVLVVPPTPVDLAVATADGAVPVRRGVSW